GYFVLRRGEAYLLVRCGSTGAGGEGWHSHNDQLSFELALGQQPLVVDPGTYAYTSDVEARNLLRSTRSHSTVSVADAEQNAFSTGDLFRLVDRTHARCTRWQPPVFEGRHDGFATLGGVTHERRLELEPGYLVVADVIHADPGLRLEWAFPLAGGTARVG